MLRILEHRTNIPRPVSLILAYPCLDFNFTSWMTPAHLRVLRTERSETGISNILHGKDHMRHKSPLSVVDDIQKHRTRTRQSSWGRFGAKLALTPAADKAATLPADPASPTTNGWTGNIKRTMSTKFVNWLSPEQQPAENSDYDSDDDDSVTVKDWRADADKSLRDRVKTPKEDKKFEFDLSLTDEPVSATDEAEEVKVTKKKKKRKGKAPIGTRLTMTSRVGYFQDRIISPSMVGR